MDEIKIVGWKKFQHYKNRNPPWIRLYREMVDNDAWRALPGDLAKFLVELWTVASELGTEGTFPADPMLICWRLKRDSAHASAVASMVVALGEAGFLKVPASMVASTNASSSASALAITRAEQRTENRGSSYSKTNNSPGERERGIPTQCEVVPARPEIRTWSSIDATLDYLATHSPLTGQALTQARKKARKILLTAPRSENDGNGFTELPDELGIACENLFRVSPQPA